MNVYTTKRYNSLQTLGTGKDSDSLGDGRIIMLFYVPIVTWTRAELLLSLLTFCKLDIHWA